VLISECQVCHWYNFTTRNAIKCTRCKVTYCTKCRKREHSGNCPRPNEDSGTYISHRHAFFEDSAGLRTYCVLCNSKLERPAGAPSGVICSSRFCQRTSAQCQLCKSLFDMVQNRGCPHCKGNGPLKGKRTASCSGCRKEFYLSDLVWGQCENRPNCGHGQCSRCLKDSLRRLMEARKYDTAFPCRDCSYKGRFQIEDVPKDPEVTAWVDEIYSCIELRTYVRHKRNKEELL
jgi:hypothetical protein